MIILVIIMIIIIILIIMRCQPVAHSGMLPHIFPPESSIRNAPALCKGENRCELTCQYGGGGGGEAEFGGGLDAPPGYEGGGEDCRLVTATNSESDIPLSPVCMHDQSFASTEVFASAVQSANFAKLYYFPHL